MPNGVFRRVVRVGPYAVKLPRWHVFGAGMRCNRWEREMWTVWRPVFGWANLCPILFSDTFGFVVIMPWAYQPVTPDQVIVGSPDNYPEITSEYKPADCGLLNGKIVALDYGIWDADLVDEARAYFKEKAMQIQPPSNAG